MDWLEVSLTANGELAEAIADVLARFAPNGVVTEQGVKHLDEEDEGTASGPITVRAYVPMDEGVEARRRQIEEALYYLGRIQPMPAPAFRRIADQNWMEAWKQHYQPIPIGHTLIVVPAWMDSTDRRRIPIKINPGMAFGTGTHPSTQLCLELMEQLVDKMAKESGDVSRPFSCIDIGCGSGILCIAALKLGALNALGVDVDPESIRNARENAAANGIGSELTLGVGSIKEVLEGGFPLKTAALVTVNILAPVIIRLLNSGLAELAMPGGMIILAGLLQHQAAGVTATAQAAGLSLAGSRRMADWVALAMTKPESSVEGRDRD